MLDSRSAALADQELVVRALSARNGSDDRIQIVVEALEKEHPTLTPQRVRSALVSLLNRGILELTGDGRIRAVK